MPYPIRIFIGDVELDAELNDSETAAQIYDALPFECAFNTWGDEIYFSIPVECGPEDAQATVALNDLGYWPPGHAFCIFYGKTPASQGDEIRPASPVNVIGQVLGDATVLTEVANASHILVEKV
jgi:uncharacterized protein